MSNWLKLLIEWLFNAPTLRLLYEPPTYSFLPEAWLRIHEAQTPPTRSRIGVHNFGSTVLKDLRIRLPAAPDYPIEGLGLTYGAWRYSQSRNEVEIDQIDPDTTLTFLLFFDEASESTEEPRLLCGGNLVGARSEWIGLLYAGTRAWVASATLMLMLIGVVTFSAVVIYEEEFSPAVRARKEYFDVYANRLGLKACTLRTLNADKGEVHEGEIAQNMNGVNDALLLNRSSSMKELLKRKRVFICVPVSKE